VSDRVRVEVTDRVARVTLADPARRNALDVRFANEIAATFDSLESRDDVGAVVVTGEPPAFCAGADLSELASPTPGDLQSIYEGFLRVARSSLPTVAAVNGPAVGAGMNLALACDIRVAASSSRFDSRFGKLGLHPGGGHIWLLTRAAGAQVAAAMVLFGEVLSGDDAARLGLAWCAVPDSDLLATAHGIASRAAGLPPGLAARIKASFAAAAAIGAHGDAVASELEPQLWSFGQPAFRGRLEAMRAAITSR
jgi:enoyl-CoA hydratase